MENELNGVKIDMSSRTTRDELNMVKTAVPNMATKYDLEEFKEQCKEFISKRDLVEVKTEVAKVIESTKKFCSRNELDKQIKDVKLIIEKLNNEKIDRHTHHDSIDSLKKLIEEPKHEIREFKTSYFIELDKINKKTDRITTSLDNKVTIDLVLEIKDQIKLLADKEKIKELESSI